MKKRVLRANAQKAGAVLKTTSKAAKRLTARLEVQIETRAKNSPTTVNVWQIAGSAVRAGGQQARDDGAIKLTIIAIGDPHDHPLSTAKSLQPTHIARSEGDFVGKWPPTSHGAQSLGSGLDAVDIPRRTNDLRPGPPEEARTSITACVLGAEFP